MKGNINHGDVFCKNQLITGVNGQVIVQMHNVIVYGGNLSFHSQFVLATRLEDSNLMRD